MIHHENVINGVRLHYVTVGEGPLVVMLHGFPDFWYVWREQMTALAAAGYRVVAPDLRGYNGSEKPRGVASYRMNVLVEDVLGLIRHLGEKHAVLVGHDWGGAIAWHTAARYPQVIDKLVVLNAPHPAAFVRALGTLKQLKKSWYMFFFQIPHLPEALLSAGNFAILSRMLRRTMHLEERDLAHYRRAFANGSLSAALNYYRAAFHPSAVNGGGKSMQVQVPTLLIWGERDPFLDLSLTEGLERWVEKLRVERIPGAGHWVQVDAAPRVNELLIEFLAERAAASEQAGA